MKKKTIAIMLGIMMTTAQLGTTSVFAEAVQTAEADTTEAATETAEAAAETTEAAEVPQDAENKKEEVTYGEVTSVENGVITIAVGTLEESTGQNQPPEMPEGEMPEGEAPDMGGGEMPEMPDGEAPDMADGEMPEMPGGGMPDMKGGMSSLSLNKTGEEMTITVTEETVITESSSSADSGKGFPGGMGQGEAPDMADGEMPEMPDGEAPDMADGEMPEMKDSKEALTIDDIEVGDIIAVTFAEDGTAATIEIQSAEEASNGGPGGMGQGGPDGGSGSMGQGGPDGGGPDGGMGQGGPGGGQSSGVDSYDAVNEYSESVQLSGETIESTGTDENAVLVDSAEAEVVISDSTITRNSEDSTGGDNSSFYGVGAALLATDGTLYVSDSTIDTDAAGGAGIFAYGDGVVYASNDTITTEEGTSGGIHVAGGGTLYAWDVNATTQGGSAAAIRSDRGSGTMVVDGGTYTSNGTGSPAIYSTADITVANADLTATNSEAICIEGLNCIRLYDCNLTGSMHDDEQNDITWNVIVYQSMSGDSEEGNGTFQMEGGTLTAENGGMFYSTNTESTITLKDVEMVYSDDNPFFLQVTGNANARGWGSSGSNGADCVFTAISQDMQGDVIWDSISQLDFYMTDGSTLTGAFIDDESWAGEGGSGYSSLYIDESSVWTVTSDSTLTNLYNAGSIVDADGNTVSIVGTDGTVYVEGTSTITVTVSSYEASADVSGASTIEAYETYAVEKPEQLA